MARCQRVLLDDQSARLKELTTRHRADVAVPNALSLPATARTCYSDSGSRPMRTNPSPARVWVLLTALMLLTLGGCRTTEAPSTSTAQETLDQLQIIDRPAADPRYRRAAFGRAWADVDRDGCNTRDQVLFATLDQNHPYRIQRQGRCLTDVLAGTWTDLYSHQEMTWTDLKEPAQAERLPLDHIVSLAGAWRYGARNWTSDERLLIANDPLNLTATTAKINSAKRVTTTRHRGRHRRRVDATTRPATSP